MIRKDSKYVFYVDDLQLLSNTLEKLRFLFITVIDCLISTVTPSEVRLQLISMKRMNTFLHAL